MSELSTRERASQQDLYSILNKVIPHVGVALDFDDTLVCSEFVTAWVTKDLVNPFLEEANRPVLTVADICTNFSGLSFGKQVELLQEQQGIVVPETVIKQKEQQNLKALSKYALPLPGSEDFLKFLMDFGFNAAVLTASKGDRVDATIKCVQFEPYLTTKTAQDDGRIPVASAGQSKMWRGKEIPSLAHKPAPDGYQFVAQALGLKPSEMIAFEDSAPGVMAAVRAEYRHVAIVSLSRRCEMMPDHVDSLKEIIADSEKAIVVNQTWMPAAVAMLELGLKNAKAAGVRDLPEVLPPDMIDFVRERLNPSHPKDAAKNDGEVREWTGDRGLLTAHM